MLTSTTYSDRIIILTYKGMRMSFRSSDIMHVREFKKTETFVNEVDANEKVERIKTTIITKVGNETKSHHVDQDFDKIVKLLYPQTEGDENEVGIDS